MAKGDRQWHVPQDCWHSGPPGSLGHLNVGRDIFIPLVVGNTTTVGATPDAADEWVVERVIGQFLIRGDEDPVANRYLHHRIYPTAADDLTVTLRDLTKIEEAESDFLWHQVDPWASAFDGDTWGNWQLAGNGSPQINAYMGRFGHFDVRVNRRIRQGFALIWHTQLVGSIDPADNEFGIHMWCRVLLREG